MSGVKGKFRYRQGDRIGGRYQVHKALLGGMGEVYLCLDLQLMEPYALKTFQQRYMSDERRLRSAFEQEAATWVALEKHPNIVRCFWMQTLDNQPFLALEWVAGEEGRGTDLRSWLRHGPLDLRLALEIALDICNGLRHGQAIQPGLAHRDLKPENILVAQGGLAKITDFGLAQIVEKAGLEVNADVDSGRRQSMVGERGIAGTPAYMAPEQWRGEPLDVRTDIYALGCILYEILVGMQPFKADFAPSAPQEWHIWLQGTQAAHENAPLPRLPAGLPPTLNEVLQRCLAKAQADRPATVDELSSQLVNLYEQHFDQPPPMRPAAGEFTAVDYNNRGVTYVALKQYTRALADYERALTLEPNFAAAYSNRGVTYHALQQYEQELADYNRAIALEPNYAIAYSNRAAVHSDLRQYARALADCDCALALDPNYDKAYYNRGNIYHDLQQYMRALTDYDRALALDPNNAEAYVNRGNTYYDMHQYERALADYDRAIELAPNHAVVYYDRGNAFRGLHLYVQALADFDHTIALDPNFTKAYGSRGNTYGDLRRYAEALADFDRTIALDPNNAIAYVNIGILLTNQGKWNESLPYFEQAAQLGNETGVQYAAVIRKRLGVELEPRVDPSQQAFDAFAQAGSPESVRLAATQFPLLL